MSQLTNYLKLARFGNALFAGSAIVAGGWIAAPGQISSNLVLTAIGGALIAAGANVHNDLCDIESDRINKPDRPLVTGAISKDAAITLKTILTNVGIILSLSAGSFVYIPCAVVFALYLYNTKLKKVPWFGSIIVSICGGLAPLLGAGVVNHLELGVEAALLAFFGFLIRETVKSVEDLAGDEAVGYFTAPMTVSFSVIKVVVGGLALLIAAWAGSKALHALQDSIWLAGGFWILTVGFGVAILMLILKWQKLVITDSSRLSFLIKLMMVSGLVALVAGSTHV